MSEKEIKNKSVNEGGIAYRVLIEPWITEETTRLMELNKYVFKVSDRTNKGEVKKAVQEIYGVTVEKVNIINIPRKFRMQGRTQGWKTGFKKAVVSLKEGDNIDLFSN